MSWIKDPQTKENLNTEDKKIKIPPGGKNRQKIWTDNPQISHKNSSYG